MAWFSGVKKKEGGERVGVLGFLRLVVAATMGCFFGCLRVKEPHSRHKTTPEKERLVHRDRNALSSLFLTDGLQESEDDLNRKTISEEIDIKELKDEAKFLKACGTLLETPVENRKVSRKWVDTDTHKEESSPLMTCVSTEQLKLMDPLDESLTSAKTCGKWVTGEGFLVGTPSSVLTARDNTRRDSTSSTQSSDNHGAITPNNETDEAHRSAVSPEAFASTVRRTNKSVHFECHSDRSSKNSVQRIKQSGSSGDSRVSMPSPYPTPLHLTDEMQTPGTVFPSYTNNMAGGTTNIRSQYVYSVLNPIQYQSQWNGLNEENSDPNHQRESPKPNDEATLISTPMSVALKDAPSLKSVKKEELSLSEWIKSQPANQEGSNGHAGQNVHNWRSPGDRPILGMVAAHWYDEEATHVSPKWWGVNGIPNTTTKYKEDQKVSWHATPFEERLEKALSEDSFISQRKQISGGPPVEFDECEESDTASSEPQSSSSHPSSVVTV
ncbi:protein JASON-like isoform X1 [Salvia splendens]|uniref:protein JASON-like isoform X1 n=1 Tax=Salvia splendens TaxID=180675 RepID=UPI001C2812B1|nr:protein JASON-like isoform X1 [Salvia splendens]